MATSVHSNNNDISNDELYARNLQKEELDRIKEELKKNRKEQLRSQIRAISAITGNDNNTSNNADEDNDVIVIDDDDEDAIPRASNNSPNQSNRAQNLNQNDTNLDEILARQLQEEFDKELASSMTSNRSNLNPNSNSIGFDNNFYMPESNRYNLRSNNSNSDINRARNNQPNRIPNSFETEMLFNIARDSNSRNNQSNLDSRNLRPRAAQPDPVNNLTNAFNMLQNRQLIGEILGDVPTGSNRRNNFPNRNIRELSEEDYARHMGRRTNTANQNPRNILFFGMSNPRSRPNNPYLNLFGDRDFTSDDYESLLRLDEMNSVKKCLTKNEIESLPTFEFKSNSENADENTCSICFDQYNKKEMLTALACSHKFHKKCIKKWLEQSRQCPLCKKDAINGN